MIIGYENVREYEEYKVGHPPPGEMQEGGKNFCNSKHNHQFDQFDHVAHKGNTLPVKPKTMKSAKLGVKYDFFLTIVLYD